jgi:hypothetical protein
MRAQWGQWEAKFDNKYKYRSGNINGNFAHQARCGGINTEIRIWGPLPRNASVPYKPLTTKRLPAARVSPVVLVQSFVTTLH